jgi:hypothetical protein
VSQPRYRIVEGAIEARHVAAPDQGLSCYFWLNGDRFIRSVLPLGRPALSLRQEPINAVEEQAKRMSIDTAYRRGMQHDSFDPQLAFPVGAASPVPAPPVFAPAPLPGIVPGDVVMWPDRRTGYAGDPQKHYLVIGSSIGRAVTRACGKSTPKGVQVTDGRETWVVEYPENLVKVGRLA